MDNLFFTKEQVHEILDSSVKLNLREIIKTGFNIYAKRAGEFTGYLFLGGFIMTISILIPLVNLFSYFLLIPPLIAGFYIVCYDIVYKDNNTSFGRFFGGFNFYAGLIGANALIILIFFVPFVLYFAWIGVMLGFSSGFNFNPQDMMQMYSGLFEDSTFIGVSLLFYILIWVVYSFFVFSYMFVVTFNFGSIEAMKASQKLVMKNFLFFLGSSFLAWLAYAAIVFVFSLLGVVGIAIVYIALFFTSPVFFCLKYAVFAQLFKPEQGLDKIVNTIGTDNNSEGLL